MKIATFALMGLIAAPAFGQTDDYASRVFEGWAANNYAVRQKPSDQVTLAPKPEPKQPIAKGDDAVDGAIVCPSLDMTMWLYKNIGAAKVARNYMPLQNRHMAILQEGYDPWEEPNPSDYRCQLVPSGTPMDVKWDGGIPVVSGTTKDGRPFAGVTNPMMIDY